ncbi:MAG TPA: nucleoside deaminase [Dehalococcoidia bacterium]|nr:nucleoside deaminase [Dehalococcoidia bacterium]
MTTVSRLTWKALAAPWQSSIEEAWASYREGSVPIGAAVVDTQGAIVATGRNRRDEEAGGDAASHGQPLAHAELNALLEASTGKRSLRGFSLYTTMEPCPLCTGALAMAHVGQVQFAARDLWAGSLGLLEASAFLRSRQIEVVGPFDSQLEEVMLALNVDFWLRQPSASASKLIELWRVAFPAAVELGESMYREGALKAAARESLPASEMLTLLETAASSRRSIA